MDITVGSIEESGMSTTKAIGKAKAIWKASKAVKTYSDEISKEEQKLFADDGRLVNLILLKQQVDKDITEHIDSTLKAHRARIQADAENELMAEQMEGKTVKGAE